MLSHFNFRHLVWQYYNQGDIIKIQKIQLMALRFVYNDFKEP